MPTLPNLNSLGKLCSSNRSQKVDRVRVKRKSSVKRMSIIEDGHVAEVLYLIPKQYMEQLPNLNPNDYYLSERLNDVATGRTVEKIYILETFIYPPELWLSLNCNTSQSEWWLLNQGFKHFWTLLMKWCLNLIASSISTAFPSWTVC